MCIGLLTKKKGEKSIFDSFFGDFFLLLHSFTSALFHPLDRLFANSILINVYLRKRDLISIFSSTSSSVVFCSLSLLLWFGVTFCALGNERHFGSFCFEHRKWQEKESEMKCSCGEWKRWKEKLLTDLGRMICSWATRAQHLYVLMRDLSHKNERTRWILNKLVCSLANVPRMLMLFKCVGMYYIGIDEKKIMLRMGNRTAGNREPK